MIGVETAAKILNIQAPEVHFNPYTDFSNPYVSSVYLKSRNVIVFNEKWLESANELEILTTCFHETRHAYQCMVCELENIENVRIKVWKKELCNTIQPKGILEEDISYLNQDTEIDAIAFSKFMMKESFELSISIPEVIKEKVLKRTKEIEGKLKEKFEKLR